MLFHRSPAVRVFVRLHNLWDETCTISDRRFSSFLLLVFSHNPPSYNLPYHTILMNLENIDTPLEEAAEYLLLLHPVHSILGWRRCFWSDEERISISWWRERQRPNIWDQISNTIVCPSNNPNIHPPSFIYSTLQTELSIISSAKSYFPVLGV